MSLVPEKVIDFTLFKNGGKCNLRLLRNGVERLVHKPVARFISCPGLKVGTDALFERISRVEPEALRYVVVQFRKLLCAHLLDCYGTNSFLTLQFLHTEVVRNRQSELFRLAGRHSDEVLRKAGDGTLRRLDNLIRHVLMVEERLFSSGGRVHVDRDQVVVLYRAFDRGDNGLALSYPVDRLLHLLLTDRGLFRSHPYRRIVSQ